MLLYIINHEDGDGLSLLMQIRMSKVSYILHVSTNHSQYIRVLLYSVCTNCYVISQAFLAIQSIFVHQAISKRAFTWIVNLVDGASILFRTGMYIYSWKRFWIKWEDILVWEHENFVKNYNYCIHNMNTNRKSNWRWTYEIYFHLWTQALEF